MAIKSAMGKYSHSIASHRLIRAYIGNPSCPPNLSKNHSRVGWVVLISGPRLVTRC